MPEAPFCLHLPRFTREYVLDIVKMYPDLVRALYVNFALTHHIGAGVNESNLK